jgi:Arc/MetJ-type ribon-helix-helix transcriptional regulator
MPSWNLVGAYDPEKFYTEASDKGGRGDPVNARIPPQVAGTIAALVQSGKIPQYRTQSDFIRDAVVHRLHTIGEKVDSGEIVRTVNLIALLNYEIQAERAKKDYNTLMSLIETRHMDYSATSMTKANQYIKNLLAEIDAIPDDFQEDYEQRLSAKLYPI